MTAAELDPPPAGRSIPTKFVWVVVGDAGAVRPQLERLGLPIEVMQPQCSGSGFGRVWRIWWIAVLARAPNPSF